MNKLETNVLVLGKSGVGKSSFINYIYGEDIREKRAGKPVTEKGLYKVRYEIGNIIVNLSDSWGLESDKTNDWKQIIMDEVKKSNDKSSIKDWFHTIYYCFSANTARIEEFEINDIIKPLMNEGNRVTIIITHCDIKKGDDSANRKIQEKADAMISKLVSELGILESDIIKVCSERKKFISGKTIEPYGKEKVLEKLKNNLWEDIKYRIPKQYAKYMEKEIRDWEKNATYKIEHNLSGFEFNKKPLVDIIKEIDDDLRRISLNIKEVTQKNILEAMTYYSLLVRFTGIKDFDIDNYNILDSLNSDLDKKMLINYELLNFIKEQLFILIPILAPLGIIVSKLNRSHVKRNLEYHIFKQADELVMNIPKLKKDLQNYLNSFDNEQLLLCHEKVEVY